MTAAVFRFAAASGIFDSATFSGKVTTGLSSLARVASVGAVRAVLQRKVRGRWVNVKWLSVKSTGRYAARIRPRTRGSNSYRIRVTSGGVNAVGVSRTIRIRVR
ncbi:MAG TPA: hypothetical protein VIK31_11300 [Propionibacteriaceae bacterium]